MFILTEEKFNELYRLWIYLPYTDFGSTSPGYMMLLFIAFLFKNKSYEQGNAVLHKYVIQNGRIMSRAVLKLPGNFVLTPNQTLFIF